MFVEVCMAKIHRATVTGADLNYQGSITIDRDLVNAAGLYAGQAVLVNSLANGVSWKTYILPGAAGKGEICLNGPPFHHFKKGDKVIILAYAFFEHKYMRDMYPKVVLVDDNNKIIAPTKENVP